MCFFSVVDAVGARRNDMNMITVKEIMPPLNEGDALTQRRWAISIISLKSRVMRSHNLPARGVYRMRSS